MNNIIKVYSRANDSDIVNGKNWYNIAHNTCKAIANETGTGLITTIAVLSALSPNNKWNRNVIDCKNLIIYGLGARYSTYGANVDKALTILKHCNNEAEKAIFYLRGKKVVSFFDNILNCETSQYVTIDGHAVNIANNTNNPLKGKGLTPKKYDYFTDMYKETANGLSIPAIHLQAITWVTWRNHGSNQLALNI